MALDTCFNVRVTVLVAGKVLVRAEVGYGPDVVAAAASSVPAVPSSMGPESTLLNFMAGPKHCLLKACPLVHSFFGEETKSDFTKLCYVSMLP